MPGVGDANAARNKIADEYRKQCGGVWIVADINRAIDDRVAKELLGENFRRQLMMDGQYASVAFVCTKTDQMQPDEVISNLGIEYIADVCGIDQEQLAALDERVDQLTQQITPLREQRKDLHRRLDYQDKKFAQKDKLHQELSLALRMVEQKLQQIDQKLQAEADELTLQELDEARKEREDQLTKHTKLQARLEATREQRLACLQDKRLLKRELDAVERRIKVLDEPLRRNTATLMGYCGRARNAYSKTRISQDFQEGLREMREAEPDTRTSLRGGCWSGSPVVSCGMGGVLGRVCVCGVSEFGGRALGCCGRLY